MTREGDGIRTVREVLALIKKAKDTGDWPGAAEQWARKHKGLFVPQAFWNDDIKEVLPGGQVRMDLCCEALRVTEQAFVGNALFVIPGFDALWQMYLDVLHVWLLGIFLHLFGATLTLGKDWMFRWVDEEMEPVLNKAHWEGVLDRLEGRLAAFGSLCPSLAVSKFARRAAHRVDAQDGAGGDPSKGGANTSAAENSKLLCALATVLEGLLDEEIKLLEDFYAQEGNKGIIAEIVRGDNVEAEDEKEAEKNRDAGTGGRGEGDARPDAEFYRSEQRRRHASPKAHLRRYAHPSTDPMLEVQEVWLALLDVYLHFRQPQTDESGLAELRRAICDLKHSFMRVFPNKSGQAAAWAFPKGHEMDYLVQAIADLGNVDVASAQHGERAHQKHVKEDCAQINRQVSWSATVMRRDDMRVVVREATRLGSKATEDSKMQEDEEDCWAFISREDINFLACVAKDNTGLLDSRLGDMDTHTWPIQYAADRNLYMTHTLEVRGGERNRQSATSRNRRDPYTTPLVLVTSQLGAQSPTLAVMDMVLALWLWRQQSGQDQGRPSPATLANHLFLRLPSGNVRLWNCLTLTNTQIPGHCARIRSYPLDSRKFHRRTRQVSAAPAPAPASPPDWSAAPTQVDDAL